MPHPSLENVRRAARGEALPYRVSPPNRLHENFWQLWAAGTFGPLGTGILLAVAGASGAIAGWVVGIGLVALLLNVGLALATHGYTDGQARALGQVLAISTGWLTVILVGMVALAALVALVLGFYLLQAVFSQD